VATNEVAKTDQKKVGIASYLTQAAVRANVDSVVGQKDSQAFISAVVSAIQTNPQLAECTNSSILSAALLGQSLKLPPSPQLGLYYFVPFEDKKKGTKEAQFMISYKGMIQLAQRSGMYRKIHVTDIRQGELKSYDPIEDKYEFEPETDVAKRLNLPVIGYYAYYELLNGYKETLYWSKEKMEAHAKRYSASYRNGWSSSIWKSDFDKMAFKTMQRQLLSKAPMSIEMQKAYTYDQSVVREDGTPDYVDNIADEPEKATDVFATVEPTEVKESENAETE
jgi:recombination protein RecT